MKQIYCRIEKELRYYLSGCKKHINKGFGIMIGGKICSTCKHGKGDMGRGYIYPETE